MTATIPRFAGFGAILLLVGSLVSLQVSNAEKDLVVCIPAYAFLALSALILLGSRRPKPTQSVACLCASAIFFGYVILRALTSPVAYAARPDLYCVLAALTLYGITATALTDSASRITLLVGLAGFAAVHVFVSVVQAGWGENLIVVSSLENVERSARGTGFYVDPDHLAGLLEILGIFALSLTAWSRRPAWVRVCIGYLAATCYFGIALTGSRGGYLSAILSLAVFVLLSLISLSSAGLRPLVKFGGTGLIVFAIALVALGFLIQRNAPLRERVGSMTSVDEGRLDLWHAAIEQWKLRPLVGTGAGTYRFYGREFRTARMQFDPVDVHNDYLHLLCEYGLIGGAGFLLFLATHLVVGWRSFVHLGPKRLSAGFALLSDRLALNIGALCAMAAYLVHSAVDFNLHIPANALILAVAFGLIADPGIENKSERPCRSATNVPRMTVALLVAILLVQCLRLHPGEYFAELSRAALRDENPARALSLAEKALNFERNNPNIFFYQGRALTALGNEKNRSAEERSVFFNKGIAAFEHARLLVPLDESYPVAIALTCDRMSQFAEAENMYQLARALDPHSESIAQLYQNHLDAWSKEKRDGGKN